MSSFLSDGAHYDACHAYLVEDQPLWAALGAGKRVLELGCGTGRVAVALAQAGAQVTGLDASPAFLAHARAKSTAVDWHEGDMRAFELPARFDLAIFAFNTFNLLLERADALASLACVRRHLAPGGRVAIDVFVPDPAKLMPMTGERIARYRLGDQDIVVTGNRSYDRARQRRRIELSTGEVLDIHVTYPAELAYLVELAGFTIEATYGDYRRGPLTESSKQVIVVAGS